MGLVVVLEWHVHKMTVNERQSSPPVIHPLSSFYFFPLTSGKAHPLSSARSLPFTSPHSHLARPSPFYPEHKSSKLLKKRDKVGLPPPPYTSYCRPHCQVLALLKVGGRQGQGQTRGKTHSLSLKPHSLAPHYPGGSTGTPENGEFWVLDSMLAHPSRVHHLPSFLGPWPKARASGEERDPHCCF